MENSTNTVDRKGQTITFYSYKGGVGRSMALVNIACLAAKENKKVLLIDCDLEAPGLHQFFKVHEETQGFVDLVFDINDWIAEEENNTEEGYCRFMAERFEKYVEKNVNPIAPNAPNVNMNTPENLNTTKTEFDTSVSVDLVKAGRFDSSYSKKLTAINWMDVYKKAPAFFRTFAYCLEKDYDYIFVDARTGLADTSGICTMLMPQKLVLVFALNNQNINGVVDVAAQAIDYRNASNDYRELHIYPLPSRIENSANPFLQQWIDNYKGKFVKLFTEKYMLDECRLSPYFDRSFIQYYAIHAYGENIPALYESAASSNFIAYNYYNFLTVLKKNIPAWEVISLEEEVANEKMANEHYRKGIDLYYKKEYDKSIEELNKAIGLKQEYVDAYNELGNCNHMLAHYEEAIAYYSIVIKIDPGFSFAYNNRGLSKTALRLYPEALDDFSEGIKLNPQYTDCYFNRALTYVYMGKYSEAIQDYSTAINLKPDDYEAYLNRGVVKLRLKQYDEALKDCDIGMDMALKSNKEDSRFYNLRACVFREMKNYELAQQNNEKSLLIDNRNADNWGTKAEIASDLGNEEGFYESIEKSLELNFNIIKEIAEEPGTMNKYITQPRFQELLKKYKIELDKTEPVVK